MKKVILSLLLLCCVMNMSAQRIYNEKGKYYEIGIVDYELRGIDGRISSAGAFYMAPSSTSKDKYYRDANGKFVVFKNFAACINYFMYLGWEILDIDKNDNSFIIRREITKDDAKALSDACVKSRR